jgi:hypothetical protein
MRGFEARHLRADLEIWLVTIEAHAACLVDAATRGELESYRDCIKGDVRENREAQAAHGIC